MGIYIVGKKLKAQTGKTYTFLGQCLTLEIESRE